MKLAEQTAAKIELAIIEQGWPLGSVLGSEADLLAEYRVSRAVLREAVRLLEHDNVAHMRRGPGGGLVVAEPDTAAVTRAATLYLRYRNVSPGQLFAARIAIELAAAKATTENIDESGIALLRETLDRETAAGQQPDVTSHDFHIVVAEISGNPAVELLTDVVTKLSAAAFVGSAALLDRTATRPALSPVLLDVHSVHVRIAEAIIAGDVGLAQHRMTRHLEAIAAAGNRSAAVAADEPAAGRQPRRRRRR